MPRRTVAVDLDGVLASYDGWKGLDTIGHPIPGAQDFVRRLLGFADVVVFTTRCNADFSRPAGETRETLAARVRRWLEIHRFPAEATVYTGAGKPAANAYVDDRAVVCRPQDMSVYINRAVVSVEDHAAAAFERAALRATELCKE